MLSLPTKPLDVNAVDPATGVLCTVPYVLVALLAVIVKAFADTVPLNAV